MFVFACLVVDFLRRKIMKISDHQVNHVVAIHSGFNTEARNENLISPSMEVVNVLIIIMTFVPSYIYVQFTENVKGSLATIDLLFYVKTLPTFAAVGIVIPLTIYVKNQEFRRFLVNLLKRRFSRAN